MKALILLVTLSFWIHPINAFAQDQILQERDIFEKAKSKKYENGAEESELQVQIQLFKPQRKIAPVIEKTEEDQSNDRD
jgi:hypothetical protein